VYGIVDAGHDEGDTDEDAGATQDRPPLLVEPMLLTRTGDAIPEYDLRDVEDTLVVRVTKAEFGA